MIIHFCLREDDGDLLYWRKSLPRGTFNYYVRQALLAEKAKRIADLPLPEKLGKCDGFVDTKLYFYDRELIQIMRACPSKKRTPYIRRVLRKQLEENANRLKAATQQADQPHIPDDDMSDEYRKMLLEMSGK